MKVPGEVFDGVKVTIDGGLSVVATLQFLEHDLAKMGHRETSFLSVPKTRSPTSKAAGPMTRDSVRRTSDLVQVEVLGTDSGSLEQAIDRAGDASNPTSGADRFDAVPLPSV